MKKLLKVIMAFFYVLLTYLLIFVFSAFFNLSAKVIHEWKKSEIVTVMPENIDIKGNSRLSKKEIFLISGLEKNRSWFDIDERKIESFLLSSGWVKKVAVKKIFPDSVQIIIEEFVPSMVINSRGKFEDNKKKILSTLWFADSEGIVFKKAFPKEADDELPFFHVDDSGDTEKQRADKIRKAVSISNAWKKNEHPLCRIRSIKYDVTSGFNVSCEAEGEITISIDLGSDFTENEIDVMKDMFVKYSKKLKDENKWAEEYIFEKTKKDNKFRVIVGKVFQNVKRGSDA